MKQAKKTLRRLALHELGHIVIDSEQNEESTEPEADIFTNLLLNLRVERRKSLRDGV
jgi:Zn-dependent peptidase ImmA (M78 family)